MTGCERILSRLERGPATAAELYAETYSVVHSRIADLRKRGHVITCERVSPKAEAASYVYRLLNEPETAITGHTSVEADDDHGSSSGSLSRLTDSDPHASRPTGPPSPAGVGAVPSVSSESVSFQLTLEEVAA